MANAKTYSQMFFDMTAHLDNSVDGYLSKIDIDKFKSGVILALRSYRAALSRKARPAGELTVMYNNCMMMLEVAYDVVTYHSIQNK